MNNSKSSVGKMKVRENMNLLCSFLYYATEFMDLPTELMNNTVHIRFDFEKIKSVSIDAVFKRSNIIRYITTEKGRKRRGARLSIANTRTGILKLANDPQTLLALGNLGIKK
jgi:hypothetical protein